jgi:hypothetical protein
LVFSHPELMVLTPDTAAAVLAQIQQARGLGSLAGQIERLRGGWAKTTIFDPGVDPPRFQYDLHEGVLNLAAAPIRDALRRVADDERLRGIRWSPPAGVAGITMEPAAETEAAAVVSGSDSYQYVLRSVTPRGGLAVEVKQASGDQIQIAIANSYVRHASIYARFLDGREQPIPLYEPGTLEAKVSKAIAHLDYTWLLGDQTTRFIDSVAPVGLFLGLPVDSRPYHYTIPLPEGREVGRIRLLLGSLGQMSYVHRENLISVWFGAVETLMVDLVFPFLSICAGVGLSNKKLFEDIFKDPKFIIPICYDVYLVVKDWWLTTGNFSKDLDGLFLDLANKIAQKMLFNARLAKVLSEYIAEEELEEAIPLVGEVMRAAALTATIAGMMESVAEIISSPAVVEYDLALSLTARIELRHDRVVGDAGFPATTRRILLFAHYTDGTCRTHRQPVQDPFVDRIEIRWAGIPVGGEVSFAVAFLSEEGWLVGRGSHEPVPNVLQSGRSTLDVTIQIEECEYPLNARTTYGPRRVLASEGDVLVWKPVDTPPAETASALSNANGGHHLSQLGSIALDTDRVVLGYSWRASGQDIPAVGRGAEPTQDQVWGVQNVSLVNAPGQGLSNSQQGFAARPPLAYLRSTRTTDGEVIAAADGGRNFWVDPRKTPQGRHLRGFAPVNDPTIPPSDPRRSLDLDGLSWGTFPLVPDDLAVHPSGVVVALATDASKLMVLEPPEAPRPDAEALPALLLSGPGNREGLVRSPVRLAVAPDGTLLVLEAGNRRLQAFDVQGNPVRYFSTGDPDPEKGFFLPLYRDAGEDAKITYTGLALEAEGHLYVTSYEGRGFEVDQFRLDIYQPTGEHLLRQRGLAMAAMTVDLWRNLFCLNFQALLGPGRRTQPSVSEYVPSTPR